MKKIPLYSGGYTLVDESDYDYLSPFTWSRATVGYAVRHEGGKTIYMHRSVMGLAEGDGMYVDHINRDMLDNRKSNLRVCTKSQNQCNQKPKKKLDGTSQSKYKGVSIRPSKSSKPWRCRIAYKGKTITKYFTTEIEAAKEYNRLAREVHGEFAYVNKFDDEDSDETA
jgi:hypothetical protein